MFSSLSSFQSRESGPSYFTSSLRDIFPEDHALDDISQDLTALNESAGSSSDDHAQ